MKNNIQETINHILSDQLKGLTPEQLVRKHNLSVLTIKTIIERGSSHV